jgi:modulator of FtsH protease HflK
MTRPTIAYRRDADWSRLRPLLWLLPVLLLLVCVFTTYYTVPSDSVGVVTRFGAFHSTTESGLHFKLPFGVDVVQIVPVSRQLKMEFGFSTAGYTNDDQPSRGEEEEKRMVTGDLSACLVEWIIQYRIDNPQEYLFHVRGPGETLRDLGESVMREVVGDRTVDEVITIGRQEIETTAKARLSDLVLQYKLGVRIDQLQLKDVDPPQPVQASFNEVNKAQQDRENMVNVANGDYNKAVPKARGEAAQKISEAEGYRSKRINEALGDVAAFNAMLEQYVKAKDVTRKRLYLETMQQVLPSLADTWIVDSKVTQLLPMVGGAPAEVRK